jgi:hypothetical protein
MKFKLYLTIEQVNQILNFDCRVLESLYKQVHAAFDEHDAAKTTINP